MKNSKAYDLPIRIFHWTFAGLFIFSFLVGKFVDDDSVLYAYHMLSGMLMAFLVFLRLIWGGLGSRTSKFSSFLLKPSDLVSYFSSLLSGTTKRHLGHNPASSYAAIAMMAFALGLVGSGLSMVSGFGGDFFEEVHELIAYAFLVVVLFHIAGVLLHQMKHKDGMIWSMVQGEKQVIEGERGISSNHPIVAVFLVMVLIVAGGYLLKSYNQETKNLNVFGVQLHLGEHEHEHEHEHEASDQEHSQATHSEEDHD